MLISSRLLHCEIWTTLNRRELGGRHAETADRLLGRVATIEMAPTVLERALGQFAGSRSLLANRPQELSLRHSPTILTGVSGGSAEGRRWEAMPVYNGASPPIAVWRAAPVAGVDCGRTSGTPGPSFHCLRAAAPGSGRLRSRRWEVWAGAVPLTHGA